MSPQQRERNTHKFLTWAGAITSTLALPLIIWVSASFVSLRDQSIRMETVPDDVKTIKAEVGVITSITANLGWRVSALEKSEPQQAAQQPPHAQ